MQKEYDIKIGWRKGNPLRQIFVVRLQNKNQYVDNHTAIKQLAIL